MKRRILLSAFALALCVSAARAIEQDGDGVYQIASAGDLDEFATLVNGGTTSACATVTADITANSGFTPIGTSTSICYTGTFDGGGHTITLALSNSKSDYQGLFGYVGSGATIKDVTVDGSVSGDFCVAGIASSVSADNGETTTISGCTNKATITGAGNYIGGIVGYIPQCFGTVTISDCQNEGKIAGTPYSCGGIVGGTAYDATLNISRCINSGNMKAELQFGDDHAGGLIGVLYCTCTIENCANLGSLATGSGVVGTLVGKIESSATLTMTGCYNSATSDKATIGSNSGTATLTRCYDISSSPSDGVSALTSDELASGALCYNLNDGKTSDTEAVWRQTVGTGTPLLSGSIVYYGYASCTSTTKTYTNTDHPTEGHKYENCVCTYCSTTYHTMKSGICATCGYYAALTDNDKVDGSYQISNAGQLMAFADIVNGTNGQDRNIWANATVTADIDFTDITSTTYTPMGENNRNRQYAGMFDGGGHTITLNINTSSNYQGLFAVVGDDSYGAGTIKNVVVAGTITGATYVGGIAGMIKYEGTVITNCTNKATITGKEDVGGIVGYVEQEPTISDCENTGFITATSSTGGCAGGIVGFTYASLTMSGCVNNGNVYATQSTSSRYAGGLLGCASGSYTFTIKNCANHAAVSGSNYSGTLVGYQNNTSGKLVMTGCYNSYVSGSGLSAIGYSAKTTLTRCYDINSTGTNTGYNSFSSTEMANGTLCYNLNGGVSDIAWYQKLTGEDADSYPVLTALDDEANVVNKGTLKEYGSTGDGSDVYFNSKTLAAENSDATKFYLFELVGATDVATSYLKETVSDASKNILVKDGENYYCANAILVDKTAYSVDVAYTAANFTYDRTLAKAGINTFILPIATSASNVNGKVYKLTSYEDETLKFDEVTTLEANTPYLVQTDNDDTSLLAGTLEDVAVSAMTTINDITAGSATHIGSYSIQKSSNAAESGYSYYGYSSGSFVKATGTWTLNPFRTMIKIKGAGVVSAKSLNIQLGDETSGIVSPSLESSPVDVYTASGVKVRSQADSATALQGLPKGIYIIGGRKVVKN